MFGNLSSTALHPFRAGVRALSATAPRLPLPLAVVLLTLALPQAAWAAGPLFPRGPGMYYSLPKLVLILAVFAAWARTCWWVDQDARAQGLSQDLWNTLVFAGGLAGLFAVWVVPWFLAALPLLLLLYAAPSLVYVNRRNQRVEEDEKVLTAEHLQGLAARYL